MRVLGRLLLLLSVLVFARVAQAAEPVRVAVGSKKFTESVILGEVAAALANHAGAAVVHRKELGGTQVVWSALLSGEIDVYPEYTGTLREEILSGKNVASGEAALRQAMLEHGVRMSRPLGFNNTYAIGMREALAEKLGVKAISDLRAHPALQFGFSEEFMSRNDGWPGLHARYGLMQKDVRAVDHDLAYRGLASGDIDVVDLYSTDAEIQYYGIRVLVDDRGHFPAYHAVLLYRADLEDRAPEVVSAWLGLEGRISEAEMAAMNARAKLDKVPESRVAADFLAEELGMRLQAKVEGRAMRIARTTGQHLALVSASLLSAIVLAIPLGVLAAKRRLAGQVILALAGVLQTIPSLALLVFLIPLFGLGRVPAMIALLLYSLLPIIRNTYAGLHDIAPSIQESAVALGLPSGVRLFRVELPMASRAILAGVKTSAVINVGTATLGALIGAGGYGQPILTGIRLNRIDLILEGAVPAALLALLVQAVSEVLERKLVPRGLRA